MRIGKRNPFVVRMFVVMFGLASLFTWTPLASAVCLVTPPGSTSGTLAGSSEVVAVGPVTHSCTGGVFNATLHYTYPAFMRVRLEKQNSGGGWDIVAGPATTISYTASNGGTFRFVVANLQSFASPWSLDYKYPVT